MKNLTELLKDIPLEEMTGGLDMNINEENKIKTNVQNGKAKIKNRAPAAVAIAACAVVAVAGAIHYRGNDIPEHGASNNSTITTDAEDSANEDTAQYALTTDGEDNTQMTNEQYAQLWYDERDLDYELVKDNICVMDSKRFESADTDGSFDVWLADVKISYPYYEFDIVIKTKDGSELPEGVIPRVSVSVGDYDHPVENYKISMYGDTCIVTARLDLKLGNYKKKANDGEKLIIETQLYINNIENISTDVVRKIEKLRPYSTEFILGKDIEFVPEEVFDHHISANTDGKWSIQRVMFPEDGNVDIDYTINSVDWSNYKVAFNMDLKSDLELFDEFYFGEELATAYHDAEYIAEREAVGMLEYGTEMYCNYDPERDYHFIKLEYADGTVENLEFSSVTTDMNDDGTVTITFNSLDYPFDADSVTAIHLGSAVVPVK
ncbi:hypothetical protein RASY3_01990 [Ruminococcus albus SY3]|uniref:Uncharacterized protein n=1 Tax=Ruminococcus albus SY3 TaxID=1341156 RepID=A0A011W081_RUMAL|nr:hypothetical protein [Ruminococcus albus]EXM40981.1 hypothetical protein RASY3_01990 [Ruminococcus albus SY3]